jgi:AraC-like DNA-binding protein
MLGDGIRIDVVNTPSDTEFRMYHPSDEVDRGYGAELGLAVAARGCTTFLGRCPIQRVEFRHQPLAALETYTDFFKVPVYFGCANNALIAATADLSIRNPAAEPGLDVIAYRWLDRLREDQGIGRVPETEHRIRAAMLTNARRGDYTTAGLARTLGMSLRTLRRQFKPADVQPQTVLEDLRRSYANEFLRDTSLSIEEIAERLGYGDERSFRRAFSRWTGMSPAQARKAE